MQTNFFAKQTQQTVWKLNILRFGTTSTLEICDKPISPDEPSPVERPGLWQLLHNYEPNISSIVIKKDCFTDDELHQIDNFVDLLCNWGNSVKPYLEIKLLSHYADYQLIQSIISSTSRVSIYHNRTQIPIYAPAKAFASPTSLSQENYNQDSPLNSYLITDQIKI